MQEETLKELTFDQLEKYGTATGITEEEWEFPEQEDEETVINPSLNEKEDIK